MIGGQTDKLSPVPETTVTQQNLNFHIIKKKVVNLMQWKLVSIISNRAFSIYFVGNYRIVLQLFCFSISVTAVPPYVKFNYFIRIHVQIIHPFHLLHLMLIDASHS